MENYFRYFPVSEKDLSWGLSVLNVGCTKIKAGSPYPPILHPAHYQFSWESGRSLQEYQLIYITRGTGIFESKHCREDIRAGCMILLHPGERHRYKPDITTGWDEYWVGFEGTFMDKVLANNYFDPLKPVLQIGFSDTLVNLFQDIMTFSNEEKSGYQATISGAVVYMLGLMHSQYQQNNIQQKDLVEETVSKARVIFRERVYQQISPEQVAAELNVGYSWFRKVFKKYTGLAPGQYLIQLKIQKAKELLLNPAMSVKQIAFDLQIESPLYFSKLFKNRVGLTPVEFRNQQLDPTLF